MPCLLGSFTPAVSVSADWEVSASVNSTHIVWLGTYPCHSDILFPGWHPLSRNLVRHLGLFRKCCWSIWIWPWNVVGAFWKVEWPIGCSEWLLTFLAFFILFIYQNDKEFLKTVQMDATWYNKTWCARSWLWTVDEKEGSYLLAAGVHWRIWGQSLLRISAPPFSHLGKGYYYLQCLLLKHSRMLRWARACEMLCKFQNTLWIEGIN